MGDSRTHIANGDPFADPVTRVVTERDLIVESTLVVGKDASLTLGQDSLIVLDEGLREGPRQICCFNLPSNSKKTQSIPYFNILSATLSETEVIIRYAKPSSKSSKSQLSVQMIEYPISSSHDFADKWLSRLILRAYGPAQRHKRIKVLINPYGGAGAAQRLYEKLVAPIFEASGCSVDIEKTAYRGHATEIAERLDVDAYDVLACASGDGLPMESFNGLARKPNAGEALRKLAVVQIPCGTGNAMSWNLNGTDEPSMAALCLIKGVRTPLDLASITQGTTRTLSFLSQSIGIVAESDLGTDNIRWMGDFRFTYGFLVRLFGKTLYPIEISVKTEIEEKEEIKRHYANEVAKRRKLNVDSYDILDKELESTTHLGLPPLKYGTINDPLPSDWSPLEQYYNLGNFYAGNMCWMAAGAPFFPASLPNDGMLDLVTVDGDISRLEAVGLLLSVENGTFFDKESVRVRKVSGIRVIPRFGPAGTTKDSESKVGGDIAKKEGFFSVDGESLPFEPFQIEVHRALGTTLSRITGIYEYEKGPSGWEKFLENGSSSPSPLASSTTTDENVEGDSSERPIV